MKGLKIICTLFVLLISLKIVLTIGGCAGLGSEDSKETDTEPNTWERFSNWMDEKTAVVVGAHPQDKGKVLFDSDYSPTFYELFQTGVWKLKDGPDHDSPVRDMKFIASESNSSTCVLRCRYLFRNSDGRTTWNEKVLTITQEADSDLVSMRLEVNSLGNLMTQNPDKTYSFRKLLNEYQGFGYRTSAERPTYRFEYRYKKSGHFGKVRNQADVKGTFDIWRSDKLSYKGL